MYSPYTPTSSCVSKVKGLFLTVLSLLAASSSSWIQEDGQTLGNMHSTLDSQQNLFTNYFTPITTESDGFSIS